MADYKEYVRQAHVLSSALNGPSKLDPKFLQDCWNASECGDPSCRIDRAVNVQVMAALERGEAVSADAATSGYHPDGGGGGDGSGGKPKKEKKSKKERGKQENYDTGFADFGPGTSPTLACNSGPGVPVGVPIGGPMSATTGIPMGTHPNMMQQQMQPQPQMQPYGNEVYMHQQQVPPPFPAPQMNTLNVDMQLQNTANEVAEMERQLEQLKGSSLPGTTMQAGNTMSGSGFGAGGFPGGSGFVGSCGAPCGGANANGNSPFVTRPLVGGGSAFGDEESDSDSDNDWWHQPPQTGNTFGTTGAMGLDSSNGHHGAGGFPGPHDQGDHRLHSGFGGQHPAQQSFGQW